MRIPCLLRLAKQLHFSNILIVYVFCAFFISLFLIFFVIYSITMMNAIVLNEEIDEKEEKKRMGLRLRS